MGFSYVIGELSNSHFLTKKDQPFESEHMEEDEETQKSIPPWVELEYAVRQ
jgi:hypothetical protein